MPAYQLYVVLSSHCHFCKEFLETQVFQSLIQYGMSVWPRKLWGNHNSCEMAPRQQDPNAQVQLPEGPQALELSHKTGKGWEKVYWLLQPQRPLHWQVVTSLSSSSPACFFPSPAPAHSQNCPPPTRLCPAPLPSRVMGDGVTGSCGTSLVPTRSVPPSCSLLAAPPSLPLPGTVFPMHPRPLIPSTSMVVWSQSWGLRSWDFFR